MRSFLIVFAIPGLVSCAAWTSPPNNAPATLSIDSWQALHRHNAGTKQRYLYVNAAGTSTYSVQGGTDTCRLTGNRVKWRQSCEAALGEACYLLDQDGSRYWRLSEDHFPNNDGQHIVKHAPCFLSPFPRKQED